MHQFREYLLGDEAAAYLSAKWDGKPGRGARERRSFAPEDELLKFDDSLKRKRAREGEREGGKGSRRRGNDDDGASTSSSSNASAKRRFVMRPPAMTRERRADMASAEALNVGAEMRRVVRTMVHGEYEAFPPHDLLRSVWKLVPSFAGNEQQDAHEFMRFLLDRLRKELSSGRYLIRMRGVVTPRRKEHSPCKDGIPNPPTRARSVRGRNGRSSPTPSFLMNDSDSLIARGGASPTNGRVDASGSGDDDGDGYIIISRWGAKRHKKGCACRPCKSKRKKEAENASDRQRQTHNGPGTSTYMSSPSSTFASPSRLSRDVTANEVKRQLEHAIKDERANGHALASPHTPKVKPMPVERDESKSPDKVTELFGGICLTRVTCTKCGRSSDRREPFMDLSLPIPPVLSKDGSMPTTPHSPSIEIEKGEGGNGEATLQQCLAAFVRNENLSGHGRYFCDSCGKDQNATKFTCIASLPPVLCLHLKRFTWKRDAMRTKLTNDVDFPLEGLDLAPYCCEEETAAERDAPETPVSTGKRSRRTPRSRASAPTSSTDKLYDLVAVITHHGRQAGSGHYTACARELDVDGGDSWQHFNDDDVNSLTTDEVRTGQGYIFMYARRS